MNIRITDTYEHTYNGVKANSNYIGSEKKKIRIVE
jgi:hypothetical protein